MVQQTQQIVIIILSMLAGIGFQHMLKEMGALNAEIPVVECAFEKK